MSHVVNPKTGRMIKVGGKGWRTLVKEGLLANDPIDLAKPLFTGNTIEEAKAKKAQLMDQVHITARDDNIDAPPPTRKIKPNHFPARRGKTVIEKHKTPRQEEIADYTARCASRTLHKHIDQLTETLDDGELDEVSLKEFEHSLKNLILEEMLLGESNRPPTRNTRQKTASGKAPKDNEEPDTDYELESQYGDDDDYEE